MACCTGCRRPSADLTPSTVVTDLPSVEMDHEADPTEIYNLLHEANEAGLVSRIAVAVQQVTLPTIHKLLQQHAAASRGPTPNGFRQRPKPKRGKRR